MLDLNERSTATEGRWLLMDNLYLETKDIDPKLFSFYEQRYDVLRFELLNHKNFVYLGDGKHKVCRFCGKSESEVTFNKIAHVIPESTGNQYLASYYECDRCNEKFGRQLESEYANFFNFYHNAMNVYGKNGTPNFQSKNEKSKSVWKKVDGTKKMFIMIDTTDNITTTIDLETKKIIRTGTVPSYAPIAVFKCFIKMAITLMPEEEVENFRETINWILNKKHSNYYSTNKKLLVRYKMIPGFNVTKYPACILYRRKPHIWKGPYMLFSLTYGCFSYFLEVPTAKDKDFHHIMNVPFPPIPFQTSSKGILDLTSSDKRKGDIQKIEYKFEDVIDVTKQMKNTNPKDFI